MSVFKHPYRLSSPYTVARTHLSMHAVKSPLPPKSTLTIPRTLVPAPDTSTPYRRGQAPFSAPSPMVGTKDTTNRPYTRPPADSPPPLHPPPSGSASALPLAPKHPQRVPFCPPFSTPSLFSCPSGKVHHTKGGGCTDKRAALVGGRMHSPRRMAWGCAKLAKEGGGQHGGAFAILSKLISY